MPAKGRGYRVSQIFRHRFFGHPALIAYIRRLAQTLDRKHLGLLTVGDLAQPRGGPTPTGHRSHQSGLDADLGYTAGSPATAFVVDVAKGRLTPLWNAKVIRRLEVAASDPAVDRVFVNPVIKRELCARLPSGTPWLGRLRPWWGHQDHFHVRLQCPSDSPACQRQKALPVGDGCDQSLDWWFTADARATQEDRQRAIGDAPAAPVLPPRCEEVLRQ